MKVKCSVLVVAFISFVFAGCSIDEEDLVALKKGKGDSYVDEQLQLWQLLLG